MRDIRIAHADGPRSSQIGTVEVQLVPKVQRSMISKTYGSRLASQQRPDASLSKHT
jgi:hypothetical protein